jgi:hypothetical protein
MENTPMRLAMKFGVSLARTTLLPRVLTRKVSSRSRIVGSDRLAGNQLHQRHVARRIEEVDAAEAPAQVFRHRFGQPIQSQTGRVGGQIARSDEGRDALVEVGFQSGRSAMASISRSQSRSSSRCWS